GYDSAFAVDPASGLYAWGYNSRGQLGFGSAGANPDIVTPTAVPAFATTTAVAVYRSDGSDQCARLQDGTYWCWGGNDYAELGYGSDQPAAGDFFPPGAAPAIPANS